MVVAAANASAQTPSNPRQLLDRAVASFESGRIAESVTAFDELARLAPDEAPYLWQRGIALYYAGRFADCRAQFESHRLVNPADVENAAWHFLCVARAESLQKARAALLPVGEDRRPPMAQIYQMFRGDATPEAVLRVAGSNVSGLFYAHLYIGLYAEARGDARQAREHVTEAAKPEYAAAGGYMQMVARVHLQQLTHR
jgi:lipoprotein NlpI